MKKVCILITLCILSTGTLLAQAKSQSFTSDDTSGKDNIVMTWNKNTPEQEMNDDIKALKEYGVTISFANVKRNDKNEITAIDVSYNDKKGSKGSLSYNSPNPIPTIKVFKQGDTVGFGEPENRFGNSPFISSFSGDDLMKKFQFNFNKDGVPGEQLEFHYPEGESYNQSKTRVQILRDDRKPLVIEDGKVIEGGEDYTQEELEEIQKNNQNNVFSNKNFPGFNFNQDDTLSEQMKKMQEQIDRLMKHNKLENETPIDKELEDSKKELEKAKKELEDARKELKKTKSSLKTQKA